MPCALKGYCPSQPALEAHNITSRPHSSSARATQKEILLARHRWWPPLCFCASVSVNYRQLLARKPGHTAAPAAMLQVPFPGHRGTSRHRQQNSHHYAGGTGSPALHCRGITLLSCPSMRTGTRRCAANRAAEYPRLLLPGPEVAMGNQPAQQQQDK